MNNTDLILLILFIVFLYCLYSYCKSKNYKEKYTNYQEVNNQMFDYLLWNGSKFLLLKDRRPIVKHINPLEFNSYQEVTNYLNENHPNIQNIKMIDLVEHKILKDPNDNTKWKCSRELAYKLNKTPNKNYEIEKCQFQKILSDNPELLSSKKSTRINSNEIKFMNEINEFF